MRKDLWVKVDAHSPQGLALTLINSHCKTNPDRELPSVKFDNTIAITRSIIDAWQQNNSIYWSLGASPLMVKVRVNENVVRNQLHL